MKTKRLRLTAGFLAVWAGLMALAAAESLDTLRFAIQFTEIMFQPKDGDRFEFLEFYNSAAVPIDLSGWTVDGLKFTFAAGSLLPGGSYGVLTSDSNPTAFTNRFPSARILGVYPGRLSNQGERIALIDPRQRTALSVRYAPDGFWPASAAGGGSSIEFHGDAGDPNDPSLWFASTATGGTPGAPNPARNPPSVRLLKVVAAGGDRVELENSGSVAASLDHWSLTDGAQLPRRYVIPAGTSIEPGRRLPIHCDSATNSPGLHAGFGLDADGGAVFLYDSRTNRVDGMTYGPQVQGYALLRSGFEWKFVQETSEVIVTSGSTTSLVINEWSADGTSAVPDWFEIYNPGSEAVILTGLSFSNSTAWVRGPTPSMVAPQGFVRVWADESGKPGHADLKLAATGGKLSLHGSGQTLIQSIDYGPQSEGVTEGRLPDGSATLVLMPGTGTPGASNMADADRDGIPDEWEKRAGLNPSDPEDANLDADRDGLSNREEYNGGTDPRDPASVFKLGVAAPASGEIELTFAAVAGRSYSVLSRSEAHEGAWSRYQDFPSLGSNRLHRISLSDSIRSRGVSYFKVVTPQIVLPGDSILENVDPPSGSVDRDTALPIVWQFRSQVEAASFTALTAPVTDETGNLVPGRYRFSNEFRTVTFEPFLPLLHATQYEAKLLAGLRRSDGSPVGLTVTTSFRTAGSRPLIEDRIVYAQDPQTLTEAEFRLTPTPGGYTFADVNSDEDPSDAFEPRAAGVWTARSGPGGSFQTTATIEQRGQSTRFTNQKSYKVRLASSGPAWRGLHTLNLNKHPYDLTRVRNKLAFDLFSSTPHLASLRTFFVRLYVDDTSYGLYTLVEDPNTSFLKAHGLDARGHLYKARLFDFYPNNEILRSESDPGYDAARFETVLEVKGAGGHDKLLRMLADVHRGGLSAKHLIEKHFDLPNYLHWLASNILLENLDTTSQNFLLYSPQGSSTWYFLPWDYDGAFDFYGQPDQLAAVGMRPRWTEGVANWWSVPLHRRVLEDSELRAQLSGTIRKLAEETFHSNKVRLQLERYHDLVADHLFIEPDQQFLPLFGVEGVTARRSAWEAEYRRIEAVVQDRRAEYFATLSRPMPFFQGIPEKLEEGWWFGWERSVQLDGAEVKYDFELATHPRFAEGSVIVRRARIAETEVVLDIDLKPGKYYYRVTARTSRKAEVEWQIAFDSYTEPGETTTHHGVFAFEVPAGAGTSSAFQLSAPRRLAPLRW